MRSSPGSCAAKAAARGITSPERAAELRFDLGEIRLVTICPVATPVPMLAPEVRLLFEAVDRRLE